ncbi:zinc finger protein 629-like [Perca flavescens]|uniref:zinc finger protein 629-like n=1 Tax=Perca flavescens TaxID=8167 RepID=UPI00106EB656|nr:zinc finger protein 629-like [Perca flavescens]
MSKLELSSKENHRQQKLLDPVVLNPEVRLHRAELPQQHVCKEEEVLSDQQLCIQERNSSLDPEPPQIKEEQEEPCTRQERKQLVLKQEMDTFRHSNNVNNTNMSDIHRNTHTDVQQRSVVKAEVPPEQQEWSPSLDQEDPEPPPHIKEEQEELWTSQEGEQLQGLEEAEFPFTSVPVKSEDDYDSPDSYLQPATHDKTSDSSEPETDDSGDWEETREPQSGLNSLQNNEVAVSDLECNTGNTSVSSSECAGSFGHKKPLWNHSGVQTGVKPFCCSVCGKRYLLKSSLTTHMRLHSEEKRFTCPVCELVFSSKGNFVIHMRIHTGERPFSCPFCSKRFAQKGNLRKHLTVHTGEKPFSCSVCSKRFAHKETLKQHLIVHTGEKSFSCSFCSQRFALKQYLKQHLTIHTGEKPFSCSFCGKSFTQNQNLKRHLTVHTGKEPVTCSVNDKSCNQQCVGDSGVVDHS